MQPVRQNIGVSKDELLDGVKCSVRPVRRSSALLVPACLRGAEVLAKTYEEHVRTEQTSHEQTDGGSGRPGSLSPAVVLRLDFLQSILWKAELRHEVLHRKTHRTVTRHDM